MFIIEPNFPEDEKSLEIIEKTAKAWNASQRGKTPKNRSNNQSSANDSNESPSTEQPSSTNSN